MIIQVEAVSVSFEAKKNVCLDVLKDISFTANESEFICILGSSGCGKTTLLNVMGGFVKPTTGQVIIEDVPVRNPSPRYLSIFQDYKLLPWRTVRKNIELGLESIRPRISQDEIDKRVNIQIETVGLKGFEDYRPTEISGGMKQRVAIARALVLEPKVIFMDEPFGALDAITRDELRNKFRRFMKKTGQTVVMVTHNLNEAIYFADKIIVMKPNPGRIATIIDVDLPFDRDVYTADFHRLRDRIFDHLNSSDSRR